MKAGRDNVSASSSTTPAWGAVCLQGKAGFWHCPGWCQPGTATPGWGSDFRSKELFGGAQQPPPSFVFAVIAPSCFTLNLCHRIAQRCGLPTSPRAGGEPLPSLQQGRGLPHTRHDRGVCGRTDTQPRRAPRPPASPRPAEPLPWC